MSKHLIWLTKKCTKQKKNRRLCFFTFSLPAGFWMSIVVSNPRSTRNTTLGKKIIFWEIKLQVKINCYKKLDKDIFAFS